MILSCCNNSENILYKISQPTEHRNDILFMAESTSVPKISRDSLLYFITDEELFAAEKFTYKNFGKIYENEKFRVNVILKRGSAPGRDFEFYFRTYSIDSKIIDSYEFASWVESEKKYCHGSINEELTILIDCNGEKDVRQISNNGRIIATSFHGRE